MDRRIGMLVPSLNTIAEDDFRRFLPDSIGVYTHRIRLRQTPGPVTVADLADTHARACKDAEWLLDMRPDAILFNCTGAAVAPGAGAEKTLAARMTSVLAKPSSNAMLEIETALNALNVRRISHVCPFVGASAEIEWTALNAAGFEIVSSTALGFSDARHAAQMSPAEIVKIALQHDDPNSEALLLSCANIRAYETVEELEERLCKPVVTTNQAALWGALRLVGFDTPIAGTGRLGMLRRGA